MELALDAPRKGQQRHRGKKRTADCDRNNPRNASGAPAHKSSKRSEEGRKGAKKFNAS